MAYKYICTKCGTAGNQKLITKGSLISEIFLWTGGLFAAVMIFPLLALLPLLYSIWRHMSRFKGCPKCQGEMISTTTPIGRSLLLSIEKGEGGK